MHYMKCHGRRFWLLRSPVTHLERHQGSLLLCSQLWRTWFCRLKLQFIGGLCRGGFLCSAGLQYASTIIAVLFQLSLRLLSLDCWGDSRTRQEAQLPTIGDPFLNLRSSETLDVDRVAVAGKGSPLFPRLSASRSIQQLLRIQEQGIELSGCLRCPDWYPGLCNLWRPTDLSEGTTLRPTVGETSCQQLQQFGTSVDQTETCSAVGRPKEAKDTRGRPSSKSPL